VLCVKARPDMSFTSKLFPRAAPAHLAFLQQRSAFSRTQLDEEIEYVQVLSTVLVSLGPNAQKSPEVEIEDEVGMPVKMSAHKALAVRTLHVFQLFMRSWTTVHSWDSRAHIYKLLAVVDFIVNVSSLYQSTQLPGASPTSTSFKFRYPALLQSLEAAHTSLIVATSWADALTGKGSPMKVLPHTAISADPNTTPLIEWNVQATVLLGMQYFYQGAYTKARLHFSRAHFVHHWKPPSLYQTFLDSPASLYFPDAAPPPAASRPVVSVQPAEVVPLVPAEFCISACVSGMVFGEAQ
jgi:hypothetical protein